MHVLRVGPHHHVRGFLKAYVESVDDEAGGQTDDAESRLPALKAGQAVTATKLDPDGHTTNPGSPIHRGVADQDALEELGIGRPSTYSSIIKTILDRGYVYKRGSARAVVGGVLGYCVVGSALRRLVDFDFTAGMEDDLDAIAEVVSGARLAVELLLRRRDRCRGFGGALGGPEEDGGQNLEDIDARTINSIRLFDDSEGREIHVRVGRYGPYLERHGQERRRSDGDPITRHPPDDCRSTS